MGMIMPLDGALALPSAACRITTTPEADWLNGVSALQGAEKSNADHFAAILRRLRVAAFFASIAVDGKPVGFGYAAVDRGMADIGSIILDPAMRGRGLGRDLVNALLAKIAETGAYTAFLQVVESNRVAVNLYRSLGFRYLYPYENLVQD
jgi:N-acetylglutamate synthase